MAERLAAGMAKRGRGGHFATDTALLAIAGCSKKHFANIAAALGYTIAGIGEDGQERYLRASRPANGKSGKKQRRRPTDPNSPFAELGKHALFAGAPQGADKKRALKSGV